MKLEKVITIKAVLRCLSGLHIGSGDTEMHIGGIDNRVVKHPLTQEPYIPGSSLKGKIRSLLEWRSGQVQQGPLTLESYNQTKSPEVLQILRLFGVAGNKSMSLEDLNQIGPSRLSFWDCYLTEDYVQKVQKANLPFTEAKAENTINRINGTAEHPRQMERVNADATFNFTLTLKHLSGDDETLLKTVLIGMKLLEGDSLGGSGTRGYGKVKFENLQIDGVDKTKDFEALNPFEGS